MRGFVLVFLKAGSSPVQLEGDFFHNASIRTSVFKSHVVSRTCQSEPLGEATTQLTRLEGVQQHPRVPGPSPWPRTHLAYPTQHYADGSLVSSPGICQAPRHLAVWFTESIYFALILNHSPEKDSLLFSNGENRARRKSMTCQNHTAVK